jgi:hypothetical protein
VKWDDIERFEECEDFVEVHSNKVMILVELVSEQDWNGEANEN